jgi:hypothetical protein
MLTLKSLSKETQDLCSLQSRVEEPQRRKQ